MFFGRLKAIVIFLKMSKKQKRKSRPQEPKLAQAENLKPMGKKVTVLKFKLLEMLLQSNYK